MSLWIPDSAARDQRAAKAASLAHALSETSGYLDYWNKRLRKLDPHLQLVKAAANTTNPDLKPGYYHVLRIAPESPPMIHVHQTPDGEFREPDDGLIQELEKGDMWNARAMRAAEERRKKREAEREAERAREAEDRRQELYDRLRVFYSPSVSMAGNWTNKAGARR